MASDQLLNPVGLAKLCARHGHDWSFASEQHLFWDCLLEFSQLLGFAANLSNQFL